MNLLYRYPFLQAARKLVESQDLDAFMIFQTNQQVREHVKLMIWMAYEPISIPEAFDENSLYAHGWLRIVLAIIGDPTVIYRVATILAKYYQVLIGRESDATVRFIASDQGFNAEPGKYFNGAFSFRVHFLEYLKIASQFKSPDWKLVNSPLLAGFVYLTTPELVRMIAECVNLNIMESIKMINGEMIKSLKVEFQAKFKPWLDDIIAFIAARKKISSISTDDTNMPLDANCFPPCINQILSRNKAGQNLAHYERLLLVSFLAFAKMSVDQIAGLFSGQPDYNADITKKQIESIINRGHTGTRYKPANCVRLESVSICCKDSDPVCIDERHRIRNPMTAYKRKLYAKEHLSKGINK